MGSLIVSAKSSKKENLVKEINASILDRGNRKFWYIKYQVFFENNDVMIKEESTKVLKTEKTLKYMQVKYLPVWVAKKEEELADINKKSKNFADYTILYLNECRELKDFKNISYRTNRVLRDFSTYTITDITKTQVKQWLISLTDARTGNFLSKNSRGKYLGVFRGVFRQVVEDDGIDRNIINDIEFNKKREKRNLEEVRPFELDEVSLLLQRAKLGEYGIHLYNYLSFTFSQGTSPSETLGLQIDDINFDARVICINRDVTKGKIHDTKNDYRTREIPIFDITVPILRDLIAKAKAKQTKWLFSNKDGSHIYDISTLRGAKEMLKNGKPRRKHSKWYKLIQDCEIDYRHIKNARHTFAVRMIELSSRLDNAITYQGIADMLGHGSLKMLNEHYAKWIKGKSQNINHSIDIYGTENKSGDTLGDSSKNSDFSCSLLSA